MQMKSSPLTGVLDYIVIVSLSALLFSFVFGMAWLDVGLWPQTEGPMFVIHILVAIVSVSAGLQLGRSDPRYVSSIKSPIVIAFFAFSLFSAVLLPFLDNPMRSLHGTLKHGVGILWHLELAICIYAASALWQRTLFRRMISISVILSTSTVFGLYLVPNNPFGVPQAFNEWVGMLALASSGIVILANRDDHYRWGYFALAIIISLIGYYLSENRTVTVAIIAMAVFWGFKFVPILRCFYVNPVGRLFFVITVAIAGVVFMYFAAPLIETRSLVDLPADNSVLSNNDIDKNSLHNGPMGTLWSRSYMVRILVNELLENPIELVTGNGFGSFATLYENHANEVPGRRFVSPLDTASNTYWDAHGKANFHSHNVLLEIVTSVGLGGAILWLIALSAMAAASVTGGIVALGFVVISTFWFPLNVMLGVIGIVFAAATNDRTNGKSLTTSKIASGLSPILTIAITALLGFTGYESGKLAHTERLERGFTPLKTNSDPQTCGFIRTKYFQESEIVIDLYSILQKRIINAASPPQEVFDRTTNILTINCMLRRYFSLNGNMRALTASLEGREKLLNLGSFTFPAMANEVVNWSDDIKLLLENIPERTEFIPPLISILLKHRPAIVKDTIEEFLPLTRQNDPVRYYLLATKALVDQNFIEYRDNIQKAVDFGFANIRPISSDTAQKLELK